MDYRETTLTVFGTTHIVRTERTGTVRQLEIAHTRAVRATLESLHAAGKAPALAAAKKAARDAHHLAYNHKSGPLLRDAIEADKTMKRIEKFKPTLMSFPKSGATPHPKVKFDLSPEDPMFAGLHEYIDPDAQPAAPAADEPRALMGPKAFLASLLAPFQAPAPAAEEPPADEPMDLEAFLNDFFAVADAPTD